MIKKFCIILLIIFLNFLSAVSLGEFYFSLKLNEPDYYLLIISVICFCIGSAFFLAQLHKSIHDTIENKKYDWKVARISKDDGKLEIED